MWEAFKDWIFQCIQFFYNFVGDWGLAIIIITIIFRLIIAPIMHSQSKSSYKMQKVQPLIQEVQQKYADDPVRQQEELQKIYAETKFNPMAGCLPMLLQIPIFMAMFQTLNEIQSFTTGTQFSFYGLIGDLTMTPATAWGLGFGGFIPYLILMLVFAFATFLPMLIQNRNTEGPQHSMTLAMGVIMTIFMLWISWSSPAGVLLFWGVSSLIGILQMQWTKSRMQREDAKAEKEIEVKPVKVDVERRVQKKRQHKKR